VSLISNTESEFFGLQFANHLQSVQQSGELLLAHNESLNTESISKLESEIESKILEKNIPKQAVKKTFFISVESLQNQLIHGQKDDSGTQHNFFILAQTDHSINIITANLISNLAVDKLKGQLNKINSFEDAASLKAYYLEHLENNELSEKGGAGLGFITMAMKSGNKIKAVFENINEKYSFFLSEVKINLE
jgi:hypothetical protein